MTNEQLTHARNCSARWRNSGECTCGLQWRIQLQTEQTMHAAWRKRAEEAEAELLKQRGGHEPPADLRYCQHEGYAGPSVNCPEHGAGVEPEAGRCPTCSRWLEQHCPVCGPSVECGKEAILMSGGFPQHKAVCTRPKGHDGDCDWVPENRGAEPR